MSSAIFFATKTSVYNPPPRHLIKRLGHVIEVFFLITQVLGFFLCDVAKEGKRPTKEMHHFFYVICSLKVF